MPTCSICHASPARTHFGAVSCRACAAFFRRCVVTRKLMIFCTCSSRKDEQYPCKLCRMEKCVAVGMRVERIQGSRDVNIPFGGPIPKTLHPRQIYRIPTVIQNYKNLESERTTIFASYSNQVTLHEFSLEVKMDLKLLWKLCETSFPEFKDLEKIEQKTLFFNFHVKWSIMEMLMTSTKKQDPFRIYSPSGAVSRPVKEFYGSFGDEILSGEDKEKLFEPIWNFRIHHLLCPLVKLKLTQIENMALFGILLWDYGYTNLSEKLAEKCGSMRKIILKELNFGLDEDSGRFFEILNILGILERAEQKCQEELELCGMYNLAVDEEMRNMAMSEKY